jgi:hypothetical protein
MKREYKPIICIDFDGVIHSYENGWQDGEIYGNATPGFFAWAIKAKDHFELVIYSSRSKTPEGIAAMREAIGKWSIDAINNGEVSGDFVWPELFDKLDFSDVKPPAFLTIDDRAICFQGSWAALDPAELLEFRTWTEIDRSGNGAFVDDYNRMIATISNFCSRYDVSKPDMIFHPQMLTKMKAHSGVHSMLGTLIFMGVRVRFGTWEQRDVFKAI